MKHHRIVAVEPGGIGAELSIKPGEELVSLNGAEIADVFDYRYQCACEELELLVLKADGTAEQLEIEKDEDEELGLEFADGLMDEQMGCRNKCVFCFIDQLPRGLRTTLYFKDDDYRLSFLNGNYVTLTNVSDKELDRLKFYHLSPLNISVHSTNPELRAKMLRNPRGADIMARLSELRGSGIELNFQIVLCKGLNNGLELRRSIEDLSGFIPDARSLSIVPAGLSRHREGLYPLELFSREESAAVIDVIEEYQSKFMAEYCTRFVYAADEFYLSAGRGIPGSDSYEDFPQIENGVGMLSLFTEEFYAALDSLPTACISPRVVSVVTGRLCGSVMRELCSDLMKKVDGLHINVYDVVNNFFGSDITVAGLLTGRDILSSLSPERDKLGGTLVIPSSMLRHGEEVFLDDMTVTELSAGLSVPVVVCGTNGAAFIDMCIGGNVCQNR